MIRCKLSHLTLTCLLVLLVVAMGASAEDYEVGGRDVIEVVVYEEPDLSKILRVSTEGYINFPLLGEVKVGGLTAAQIEEKLAALLGKDYLVSPQVSVTVKEYRSKRVFVLGAVKDPGSYDLMGESSIVEMLSRAGGLDKEEGGGVLLLIRPNDEAGNRMEDPTTFTIDMKELLGEGNISLDRRVQHADLLYVPKADSVYIFGEVNKPGPVKLQGKDITLIEALTRAGGFTKMASANKTKIIRLVDGKENVIRVKVDDIIKSGEKNKDVLLKPGDVIVVPESFF